MKDNRLLYKLMKLENHIDLDSFNKYMSLKPNVFNVNEEMYYEIKRVGQTLKIRKLLIEKKLYKNSGV